MEKNTVKKWLIWVIGIALFSVIVINVLSFILEGKIQYSVSGGVLGSSILFIIAVFSKASTNNTQGLKKSFEDINDGILDIKDGVLNVKEDVINIKSDLIDIKEENIKMKEEVQEVKKKVTNVAFMVTEKELQDAEQFEFLTNGFLQLENKIKKIS